MNVKEVAESILKKYKTSNPFSIAEHKGIIIQYENLGNIMGYYNEFKRFKVIHLNQLLQDHEFNFVCAHELGHALLHSKVNTPFLKRHTLTSIDKIEREANMFAVELLLPDEVLRENAEFGLIQMGKMIGIPDKLIYLKGVPLLPVTGTEEEL